MPIEIANKTVKELRSLGFKDIANFTMTPDPVRGGMQPKFDASEKQRMLKILKEMEEDKNDPDYHLDTMGEPINNEDESLDHPRNEKERVIYGKIKEQKRIDDARIILLHKALDKGIPLWDDPVYQDALNMYPYYQKKLEHR